MPLMVGLAPWVGVSVVGARAPYEVGTNYCETCGKAHRPSPGHPSWKRPVNPRDPVLGILRGLLLRVFSRQQERVAAAWHIATLDPIKVKALPTVRIDLVRLGIPKLSDLKHVLADAKEVNLGLEMFYDRSLQKVRAALGVGEDVLPIEASGIQEAIRNHAIRLCHDTAITTELKLADALAQVRAVLGDELEGGYDARSLSEAVQRVFTDAEEWRSTRIALTESSMAIHDGEILAGKESGVVAGYEPLISPDACELCQQMGEAFPFVPMEEALDGLGKYASLTDGRNLPPYHPNCECSQASVLTDED